MSVQSETLNYWTPEPQTRTAGGDVLACGFGITAAVWIAAYLCRLPFVQAPAHVTIGAMLAAVAIGGFVAARYSPRGWPCALWAGALSGILDLLLVGALYKDIAEKARADAVPSIALWIVGSIACNTLIASAGGFVGKFFPSRRRPKILWTQVFAIILAATTLLLIAAGGLVTAFRAGLAVPDWPQSYGYNMFLFPLSLMQQESGRFYEHAHRLMGSLVGLTALTLAEYILIAERQWNLMRVICTIAIHIVGLIGAGLLFLAVKQEHWYAAIVLGAAIILLLVWTLVHLWRTERRGWLVVFAWLIFIGVCAQGILGGTRVTETSITLAIAHGVFAQIVFAAMVVLAAVTSRNFLTMPPVHRPDALTDRRMTACLVAAVIVQLILGALLRHLDFVLMLHISMATLVTVMALACGIRAWGLNASLRPLLKSGLWLMAMVAVQIALGLLALAFRAAPGQEPTITGALITTCHQANGALLLALSALLATWTRRLLAPGEVPALSPVAASI